MQRQGQAVALTQWGDEVLAACEPLAAALDATHGCTDYSAALREARALMQAPERTPLPGAGHHGARTCQQL